MIPPYQYESQTSDESKHHFDTWECSELETFQDNLDTLSLRHPSSALWTQIKAIVVEIGKRIRE